MDRDTVEGIVHKQILHPRKNSMMPRGPRQGRGRERRGRLRGLRGRASRGDDEGALATAGLAQAKTGEQIFTAAGCAGCHTFAPGRLERHHRPEPRRAGRARPATASRASRPRSTSASRSPSPEAFLVEGFGNAMPSFEGRLTDEQIQALVDYLLQTGGG